MLLTAFHILYILIPFGPMARTDTPRWFWLDLVNQASPLVASVRSNNDHCYLGVVGFGPLALIKWASSCDEKGESCIMPLQHSLGHALRTRDTSQNRRLSENVKPICHAHCINRNADNPSKSQT